MEKSTLQRALGTWGPIKIKVDKCTQEMWATISEERLRRTLAMLRKRKSHTRLVHIETMEHEKAGQSSNS